MTNEPKDHFSPLNNNEPQIYISYRNDIQQTKEDKLSKCWTIKNTTIQQKTF